jgi:nitroreductase
MMDFPELLVRRQSVRRFQARPVEPEKARLLAEAARLAPSACNIQPVRLVLVDDPPLREQVALAARGPAGTLNTFVPEAPLLAVLALERTPMVNRAAEIFLGRELTLIDLGLAAGQLCLQATELGLGTCMLGWFDERKIRKLLGIPRSVRVGLVIAVGYPPEGYPLRPKSRKPLAETCRRNRWDVPSA